MQFNIASKRSSIVQQTSTQQQNFQKNFNFPHKSYSPNPRNNVDPPLSTMLLHSVRRKSTSDRRTALATISTCAIEQTCTCFTASRSTCYSQRFIAYQRRSKQYFRRSKALGAQFQQFSVGQTIAARVGCEYNTTVQSIQHKSAAHLCTSLSPANPARPLSARATSIATQHNDSFSSRAMSCSAVVRRGNPARRNRRCNSHVTSLQMMRFFFFKKKKIPSSNIHSFNSMR